MNTNTNTNMKEFMKKNMYALGALVVVVIILLLVLVSGNTNSNTKKEKKIYASQLVTASSELIYDCKVADAPMVYSFSFMKDGKNKVALTESIGTGCPDAEVLAKSKKLQDEEIVFSEDWQELTRENGDVHKVQALFDN